MHDSSPPRVVVADQNLRVHSSLVAALTRAGIEVVATAGDGDQALAICERHRPDALTLDLDMPGVDGLEVLRAIRELAGPAFPVIVMSSFSVRKGSRAIDALADGAFDLVAKLLWHERPEAFEQTLAAKVRLAAASRGNGSRLRSAEPPPPWPSSGRGEATGAPAKPPGSGLLRAVVIATSTGGPRALARLLPRLPCPLGAGTVIVQHMPAGFTRSLSLRLDAGSRLRVQEALGDEALDPATVLLAPGGRHLRLSRDGRTTLSDGAAIGGLRPRADLLIEDAAVVYGERLLLVVLTGMGNDSLPGGDRGTPPRWPDPRSSRGELRP